MTGPQLAFADKLHAQKYRGEGESFREAMNRVAFAMKDNDDHFRKFRDILLSMRFMPAGRIQSAMGSTRQVTPYNCYVSGTIEDTFVDGHGCIMDRAREAAATMRMGGGIGYDFSSLRPRGAMIKKLGSRSSGPVSFMSIFDSVCRCVASSGHRRGAQMGVMRIDHPDIEEFIHTKQPRPEAEPVMEMLERAAEAGDMQQYGRWHSVLQELLHMTGFNLSIGITDEFMECLEFGKPFKLQWGGQVYREVDPLALWEMTMRSTWDWAEPGVLFIDTINMMNNLYYCERIAATNPCGEQPLPPYGACLLGSFNLVKYLVPCGIGYDFDWDMLGHDIPHVVRAMDNVIDRASYPLYEQEKEAKSKRRMGLGITGFANASEALGWSYGSPESREFERQVLNRILNDTYQASARLAEEKGAFPLYRASEYMSGAFVQSGALREPTLDLMRRYGMRNSHLTSIAPTGTISLCADNISSGIEPVFSHKIERTVIGFDGPEREVIEDYGSRVLGVRGKTASEVSISEHIDVLATAYEYVDSAVSKTCNVPADTSWEDFKSIYIQAHQRGCKGCTTYQVGGRRAGVLNVVEEDSSDDQPTIMEPVSEPEPPRIAVLAGTMSAGAAQAAACFLDPVTGRRECE